MCYRGLLGVSDASAQIPAFYRLCILDWSMASFFVSSLAQEYASLGFTELNQRLRENYQASVSIYVNPSREVAQTSIGPSAEVSPTQVIPEITRFGVAHEQSDKPTVILPEDLPS